MRVFLAGHEGSKFLLPASAWLTQKYLSGFDIWYLNFGERTLPNYISLDTHQHGGVASWSHYIARYLEQIEDPWVVFALDDYLLAGPPDLQAYQRLQEAITDRVVCARLCTSGEECYSPSERTISNGVVWVNHTAIYSVTTQYCLWERRFLTDLLGRVRTPWEFEIEGSKHLNWSGKCTIGTEIPMLEYPYNSALSGKWPGRVKVVGNPQADIQELVDKGYLKHEMLIYG